MRSSECQNVGVKVKRNALLPFLHNRMDCINTDCDTNKDMAGGVPVFSFVLPITQIETGVWLLPKVLV